MKLNEKKENKKICNTQKEKIQIKKSEKKDKYEEALLRCIRIKKFIKIPDSTKLAVKRNQKCWFPSWETCQMQ